MAAKSYSTNMVLYTLKGKLRKKKKKKLYIFPDVYIWMFICILAFYYVG